MLVLDQVCEKVVLKKRDDRIEVCLYKTDSLGEVPMAIIIGRPSLGNEITTLFDSFYGDEIVLMEEINDSTNTTKKSNTFTI